MWTFLRLALRNVTRAKARSAITLAALFFGAGMSLFLQAFVIGVGESLIDDTVEGRIGAFQVHRAGYYEKRDRQPLALDIRQDDVRLSRLAALPNVKAVTPRLTFNALLTTGARATAVSVTAVDVESQAQVLPRAWQYVDHPLTAQDEGQFVLGMELSRALGLQPGATLMLQAQTQAKRENALDVELRGTLGGANPLESKRAVVLPLRHAQKLLGMDGKVTELAVQVKDRQQLDATVQAARELLGSDFEVHAWHELRPAIKDVTFVQRAILSFVSFIFLVIAIFGVANTLLMSVMERTKEIGTLLAVGMKRGQVALLFVLEALAQAVLGSALGLLAAWLVVSLFVMRGGFELSLGGEGTSGFTVVPRLLPQYVGLVLGATWVGSVLAALYPAYRAGKLRPVEALASN